MKSGTQNNLINILKGSLFIKSMLVVISLFSGSAVKATDFFWVGGTGNWSDPMKWYTIIGGTGGAGIPTANDHVFFNASSGFTPGNNQVIIDMNAVCRNMNWTGATNTPDLAGVSTNTLRVSGSLTFNPSMTITFQGSLIFDASVTGQFISMNGIVYPGNIVFAGTIGSWNLMDAFNMTGSLTFSSGTLNFNNQPVSAYSFNSSGSATRTLQLTSSKFTLSSPAPNAWNTSNALNMTFMSGSSELIFSSITGGGLTSSLVNILIFQKITGLSNTGTFGITGNCHFYGRVYAAGGLSVNGNCSFIDTLEVAGTATISGNCIFQVVRSVGLFNMNTGSGSTFRKLIMMGDGIISSSNIFDTLVLSPGKSYSFLSGGVQTVNSPGLFDATGMPGQLIDIRSTSPGSQAQFSKSGGSVCADYLIVTDLGASGGAIWHAGSNSQNSTNNSGWQFISCCALTAPAPATPLITLNQCGPKFLSFNGTPPQGVSWYWQGNICSGSVSLGSAPGFQVNNSGTYYLRAVVDSSGCWSDQCASVNVVVNNYPVVIHNTISDRCEADPSVMLTGGSPQGGTYSGPGVSGGMFSPSGAGVGTHTLTYSYTDGNGCSGFANMAVNVIQNPPVPVVTLNGNILSSSVAVNYQWYFNGTPISGANAQTYNPMVAGNYSVSVTDSGCSSVSPDFGFIPTSSPDYRAEIVQPFPNPGNGIFKLGPIAFNEHSFLLIVSDLQGRIVFSNEISSVQLQNDLINLTGYTSEGIYIGELTSGNSNLKYRFRILVAK